MLQTKRIAVVCIDKDKDKEKEKDKDKDKDRMPERPIIGYFFGKQRVHDYQISHFEQSTGQADQDRPGKTRTGQDRLLADLSSLIWSSLNSVCFCVCGFMLCEYVLH